ncbi:hypothetical protein CBR_g3652 [Chara braunii]|uniref:Uncharacterized protein n=1 Tax=Chara braunii TaxID=69332 RepID=A0A388KG51_CHABU|nr:hypothetical protein CBR_g3652 [Chara braunii]|eukprot:GBG68953.1 hypothetical protein CBR_g3652 [Chara braunii]
MSMGPSVDHLDNLMADYGRRLPYSGFQTPEQPGDHLDAFSHRRTPFIILGPFPPFGGDLLFGEMVQ